MKQNKFLIVAFLWSAIGIFVLILIANSAQPKLVPIAELANYEGQTVIVEGAVKDISVKTKATFIDLEQNNTIVTAVLFNTPNASIKINDRLRATGKVEYYKGELEIVVGALACLSC